MPKPNEVARDGLIASAVRSRKIAPDRADDYKRLYDADPQGIHHLLTAPVEKGGLMAGNAAALAPFETQPDEYPAEWIEQRRPHGTVAFEDNNAALQAAAEGLPPIRPHGGSPGPAAHSRVTFGSD